MKIVWFVTGNGMVIGSDLGRRCLFARLLPSTDHPEDRSGPRPGVAWKYPDLLKHTKTNREKYLADALTIVSAYIKAGRPSMGLSYMGSFNDWSQTIRSSLVWAGAADPCATVHELREVDLDDQSVRRMIECWPVEDGVEITATSLIEWAMTIPPLGMDPSKREFFERTRAIRESWRSALLEWLPAQKGDLPTARDLGYALKAINNSIYGDCMVKGGKHTRSGVPWQRIRTTKKNPESELNTKVSDAPSLLTVIK